MPFQVTVAGRLARRPRSQKFRMRWELPEPFEIEFGLRPVFIAGVPGRISTSPHVRVHEVTDAQMAQVGGRITELPAGLLDHDPPVEPAAPEPSVETSTSEEAPAPPPRRPGRPKKRGRR